MNYKKIESQVMINGIMLDEKMKDYVKKYKNKFVVFNKGEAEFTSTFQKGIEKGIEKYGENIGFVVRKVTTAKHIFSNIVVP